MSTGCSQTSGGVADSSDGHRSNSLNSILYSSGNSSSLGTSDPKDSISSRNSCYREPNKHSHLSKLSNMPGNFEPLPKPIPAGDSGNEVSLIRFLNGVGVYKVGSPKIEGELGRIRTTTAIGTRWLSQPVEPRRVGITLGLNRRSSINDEEEKPDRSAEPQALKEGQLGWETTHLSTPSPQVPDITDINLQKGEDKEQTSDGIHPSDGGQVTLNSGEDQSEMAQLEAPEDSIKSSEMAPLVINEYIEIRRSSLGGWGMFAVQDLKYGDPILLETPILRSTFLDLARDFESLDEKRKQVYFNLHSYYPDTGASDIEKIWNANAFSTGRKNSVFEIAARFNHSHAPNVWYRYDMRRNIMVMTVVKDVGKGEELMISYGQSPQALYSHYGFCCTCGACAGFSDEDIKCLKDSVWSN